MHSCLVYFTDDCRLCLLWPSSYESNDANTNLVSTHLQGVDTTAEQENSSNDNLYRQLKCFWELETIGVKSDENLVHDQFNQTDEFKNGRYEVRLPWRESHPILPGNFEFSERCLAFQVNCLRKDPELFREYDELIKKQIDTGIVEEVPS